MASEATRDADMRLPALSAAERRTAALANIDEAKFRWFHAKACIVAGVGFFTEAYDVFSISIAATMIGYVYHAGGSNTSNQDLGIKVAHAIGTFFGQLLFGWAADRLGRKRMYGVELMLMIIGTLGQALSGQSAVVSVYGVLIVWRFIMGLGVGGDYPLSAVMTSEFAARRIRGRMMTAVFAAQGFGNFAAALVALIVVTAFKEQIIHDDVSTFMHVDYCWRILIGLGCIPGAIALYFRLTVPETPRYTMDIERNIAQASQDVNNIFDKGTYEVTSVPQSDVVEMPKATWKDFVAHFGQWKYGKVPFGTAWSWFAIDLAFYVGNIVLAVGGLIPGYWFSFAFIDFWGRKPIQFMGFAVLTVIFVILGFAYDKLQSTDPGRKVFVFLYCMANFFQNFGPNSTTFVIPGEVFPTRYRSTGLGISAASGKLGAIIAQVGFSRMINIGGTGKFLPHILEIFALFMASGIGSTLLLPETKSISLENLSQEEETPSIGETDQGLPVVPANKPEGDPSAVDPWSSAAKDLQDKDLQQD